MPFLKTLLVAGTIFATVLPGAALAQNATRDLAKEEANRTLVVDFYDRFFNQHETEKAAKAIAEDYIQHNPEVPDGKEPFVSYFTGFFAETPVPTRASYAVPRMATSFGCMLNQRTMTQISARPWTTSSAFRTG